MNNYTEYSSLKHFINNGNARQSSHHTDVIPKLHRHQIKEFWTSFTHLSDKRLKISSLKKDLVIIKINLSSMDYKKNKDLLVHLQAIGNFCDHLQKKENITLVVEELDLSHNEISEKSLLRYPSGLPEKEKKLIKRKRKQVFKSVKTLKLSDTKCSDYILKHLKQLCPKAKSVYMDNCPLITKFPSNADLPSNISKISLLQTSIKHLPNIKKEFPALRIRLNKKNHKEKASKAKDELENKKIVKSSPRPKTTKTKDLKELPKFNFHYGKEGYVNFIRMHGCYPHSFETFQMLETYSHSTRELVLLCSLKPDLLKIILNMPNKIPQNVWQNYIIRKDGWNRVYQDTPQELYGNWMHQTCQIAVLGLKEGKWDFEELIHFLKERRGIFAELMKLPASRLVGSLRPINNPSAITRAIEDYAIIPMTVKQTWTPDGNSVIGSNCLSSPTGKSFTVCADLKGEKVHLSQIICYDEPSPNPIQPMDQRLTDGDIIHTITTDAIKIMEFVKSDLYPKALNENNPDQLTEDLGRIFWWICQAKPWILGDPSIAETLIRTIWELKELESPPWKVNLIPWVAVMLEPDIDNFAKNFHRLFEWKLN